MSISASSLFRFQRTMKRFDAAVCVSRRAGAGQLGMMDLYNQIVDGDLNTGVLPIRCRSSLSPIASYTTSESF
jgi:hypothetical protein